MAGYNGYSKSNNAAAAEAEGRFPLTEAARRAKVPTTLIKRFVRPSEWHHSSGWYNRVDYYDTAEIRVIFGLAAAEDAFGPEPNPEAITALAAYRPEKASETRHEGCAAEWLEWSGTRNHPKATERRAEGIAVTIKGQFATLHLPAGDLRKKIGARGFIVRAADGKYLSNG